MRLNTIRSSLGPSSRASLYLVVVWVSAALAARAEDCNRNGSDDETDIYSTHPGFELPPAAAVATPALEAIPGDWSGDGKPDLALRGKSREVYLVKNLGNRTLGTGPSLDVGFPVDQVALSDLDGDRDLDLVTWDTGCEGCSSSGRARMIVSWNDGSGGLAAGKAVELDPAPRAIQLADVVGSPAPDLVVVELSNNGVDLEKRIVIHESRGDGTFGATTEIQCADVPVDVDVIDVNDDQKADIVVGIVARDSRIKEAISAQVFLNDGNGGFRLQVQSPALLSTGLPLLVDLTGDGVPDIASFQVVNPLPGVPSGDLEIRVNDGTGRFGSAGRPLEIPGNTFSISSGDLDGDGQIDLVAAHGDAITILRNERGPVSVGESYLVPGVEGAPAVADMDLDGKLDLAAAGGDGGVTILYGKGKGEFTGVPGRMAFTSFPNYVLHDFNKDGRQDLLFYSRFNAMSVFLNRGDGTLSDPIPVEPLRAPDWASVADFDGDGSADIAILNQLCDSCPEAHAGAFAVYYGDGAGRFVLGHESPGEYYGGQSRVGDLDGDGRADVVTSHGSGLFHFYWNEGRRSFSRTTIETPDDDFEFEQFEIFDMNLDGLPDLAYHAHNWGLVVQLNLGDRTFGPAIHEHLRGRDKEYFPFLFNGVSADLDGDSLTDLVRTLGNSVCIGLSLGDGKFSRSRIQISDADTTLVIAGLDVEGDGDLDIAAAPGCNATCGALPPIAEITLLLNDGQGHFTRQKPFAVGTNLTEIHAEDYDGDGRTDLLVHDLDPALNRLLLNRGGGDFEPVSPALTPRGTSFLIQDNFDIPVTYAQPAIDLDQDGDLDMILVWRNLLTVILQRTTPAASQDIDRNGIPDECQRGLFHRGDANSDGRMDIADAVFITHHLFRGGAPSTCAETEDSDNNGTLNISDAVLILNHLFRGGLPPVAPGPAGQACGFDSDPEGSPGALGCAEYSGC